MKTYECKNKDCALGSKGVPGRFTGGLDRANVQVLNEPPGAEDITADFLKGRCPNCGEKGKEI